MSVQAMDDRVVTGPPPSRWRSAWAVFAGLLANFVLAMGTDAVLHATGVYPREWMQPMETHLWALALAYRVPFAVVGGYLVARLAPGRPMKHVAVLMAIGVVLGLLGAAGNWDKGPGPNWFMLGIVATGLPCTWLGGWLFVRRAAPARL